MQTIFQVIYLKIGARTKIPSEILLSLTQGQKPKAFNLSKTLIWFFLSFFLREVHPKLPKHYKALETGCKVDLSTKLTNIEE